MAGTPDALIRQWFDQLWNKGDESTIDRMLSPNTTAFGLNPAGGPIAGTQGFKDYFRRFRAGFPDIHIDVLRTVTENDWVVAYCHCTGTHTGPFLGKAATQKPVDFIGMVMVRVAGGQFIEGLNAFDFLSCYQQIDLMPKLDAPA